jgi:putative DNA primase/helicase
MFGRNAVKQLSAIAPKGFRPYIAGASTDVWRTPDPLPEGLPAVAAFDFALLPETLRPWAEDICERVQCPGDYVGASIMAGLGSLIGRRVGMRPQDQTDWTVFSNQWAILVGRPGLLKSPAMEAALSPVKRLQAKAVEEFEGVSSEYDRAAATAKLRSEAAVAAARKRLSKDSSATISDDDLNVAMPEEPVLTRYLVNDSTAQALAEIHRQNPNGLLVHRDEMVSLLSSLDREDNAEARGFYLTGWAGDSSYIVDRIGRGMNLHVPAVCLSLLGSTQPGRLSSYLASAVRGGSGDDGLVQRFGLLVWPDVPANWRDVDRWPNSDARQAAFAVFERLAGLDALAAGARQDEFADAPYLRFGTEGLEEFRIWRERLEARLRSGDLHPALESHLAKYRKLVPALALTLHLSNGGSGPVGPEATIQALAWAEYLETHAVRAYASVTSAHSIAARALLQKIRSGAIASEFSGRDVYRHGWAQLADREQTEPALRMLVEHEFLRSRLQETGGRTAMVYTVNPLGMSA